MSTPELNPFGQPLPVFVRLRDGSVAVITELDPAIDEFPLIGHRRGATDRRTLGPCECWALDGRFSLAGRPDPADITGYFPTPTSTLQAFPPLRPLEATA